MESMVSKRDHQPLGAGLGSPRTMKPGMKMTNCGRFGPRAHWCFHGM
jgi:hypothetical protein